VEFGAPKPIRENGPRLITEHTKLTKGTKKTRILFDGLRPVGGAALRAVMEVRVGWITSRRGLPERLVIQPTLTSMNAGRFRAASPPTGETVDTWLVAFVSLVFFVILVPRRRRRRWRGARRVVVSSHRRSRAKRNRLERKEA
jgi:hypothetical protein